MSLQTFLQRHSDVSDPLFSRYIEKRGLKIEDAVKYRLGFLKYSGLDWKAYKVPKLFNHSVVLPLFDDLQQPIGFELRSIEGKHHFKWYDPDGRYYFFGMNQDTLSEIYKTETVFLLEGSFDTISFGTWKPNVLGLLTNMLGTRHLTFLKRYVSTIYMCFDLDKEGLNGQNVLIPRLQREGFKVKPFPCLHKKDSVKDVNAFIQAYGRERLLKVFSDRFKFL